MADTQDKNKKKQSRDYQAEYEKRADEAAQRLEDMLVQRSQSVDDLKQAVRGLSGQRDQSISRNDWLEVAQTLGDALARGGAAAQAGDKYVSRPDTGKGVDYQSRSNRAMKQYEQDVGAAEKQVDIEDRRRRDLAEAASKGFDIRREPLREAIRTELESKKTEAEYGYRTGEAARKAKNEQDENTRFLHKLDDKELDDKEKSLSQRLSAFDELESSRSELEDMSPKNADKVKAKLGNVAGKAGINLPTLAAELEKTDKPGRFFGTNPDPEARKQILDKKRQEIVDSLDTIRKERETRAAQARERLGGSPPRSTAPAASEAQAPAQDTRPAKPVAPAGQVALFDPRSGKWGFVPEANKQAALKSGLQE